MPSTRDLNELARLYGLQTAYEDVTGKRRAATREALLRILQLIGAPVEKLEDATDALRQLEAKFQDKLIEPVLVAWNGRLKEVAVWLRADEADQEIVTSLQTEQGERKERVWRSADLQKSQAPLGNGKDSSLCSLPLTEKLPLGYHCLSVTVGGRTREALIIAAPRKIDTGSMASEQRQWGVFVPMYALHGNSGWGAGSVTDFDQFAGWVRGQGGTLVAALPLLASFFDNPWDISPYSPASRLFWNEFFVDLTNVPELAADPQARAMIEAPELQQQIAELRAGRTVDHKRLMQLKRPIIERLAERFFSESSPRREQFEQYRRSSPDLEQYARFRAVCERHGRPWTQWPEHLKERSGSNETVDATSERYHQFSQWLAHEQLESLSKTAASTGMTWYLDLPLGTSSDGYDAWRYREVFAVGASGGAPPDAFFTKGQSWGFPPLHPHNLREQHYEYFIKVIRHHLRQARLLRIDHVMGLHRLYWVPDGLPATHGVYVKYPAEELYAVLLLEAHRHHASIIGENLGTVPLYVNRAMRQHGFGRLYVLQYEMQEPATLGRARSPDPDEVASLNTHDMPPFATWWEGKDIDDRLDLGLLDDSQADLERATREQLRQTLIARLREQGELDAEQPDTMGVLRACLRWLARSDSRVMLVNLEDLWLETQSQNVPGTVSERVNWQRKTRLSLDEVMKSSEIAEILREVNQKRREVSGAADEPSGAADERFATGAGSAAAEEQPASAEQDSSADAAAEGEVEDQSVHSS